MHEQDVLRASVEDNFIVLKATELLDMLLEEDILEGIAEALESSPHNHRVLIDFSNVEPWLLKGDVPRDARNFAEYMVSAGAQVLCEQGHAEIVKRVVENCHNPIEIVSPLPEINYTRLEEHNGLLDFHSYQSLSELPLNTDALRRQLNLRRRSDRKSSEWLIQTSDMEVLLEMIENGFSNKSIAEYVSLRDRSAANIYRAETGKQPYRPISHLQTEVEFGLKYNSEIIHAETRDFATWLRQKRVRGLQSTVDTVTQTAAHQSLIHELLGLARNSLLVQYLVTSDNDRIVVSPYHTEASYNVDNGGELLLAKPYRLAKCVALATRNEVRAFEKLLNNYSHETQITEFLTEHPGFFGALGYGYIHHQVVLDLDDGRSLRPDFLVQPYGSDLYDILECKRPEADIFIGGDKDVFSAKVGHMVNQLEEYQNYFSDPKKARFVQEKYGVRVCKPRLIGVIGNRPPDSDDALLRRKESMYSDLRIVTFDQLLKAASQRLLT